MKQREGIVQNVRGLRASNTRFLRDSLDAMHYCTVECPNRRLGCAVDCKVRKHFEIPPHGLHYPNSEPVLRGERRGKKEAEL
jgi:hypothetical protein